MSEVPVGENRGQPSEVSTHPSLRDKLKRNKWVVAAVGGPPLLSMLTLAHSSSEPFNPGPIDNKPATIGEMTRQFSQFDRMLSQLHTDPATGITVERGVIKPEGKAKMVGGIAIESDGHYSPAIDIRMVSGETDGKKWTAFVVANGDNKDNSPYVPMIAATGITFGPETIVANAQTGQMFIQEVPDMPDGLYRFDPPDNSQQQLTETILAQAGREAQTLLSELLPSTTPFGRSDG